MKLRSSLALKVAGLLAVPLIVQWILLAWLMNLQGESERALERSIHAKDVADAIGKLKEDMYKGVTVIGAEASPTRFPGANPVALTVMHDYTNLLLLTSHDDPSLHRAI